MKCNLSLVAAFLVLCWVSGVRSDPPAKASGCKPLHGVTYDPFSTTSDSICLPVEQVIIDVQIMATFTKSIRIYSLAVCPETTMALMKEAQKQGLSVLLGVYIGESAEENEAELEMIETLMEEYSGVVQAIVVGNNAIINGKIGSNNRYSNILSNVELLVEFIDRVKEILNKNGWNHPVTTAEGWGVWESEHGATLAEAIDFICLEMNPYYEGFAVECPIGDSSCIGAANYANAKAEGLAEFYTKDVWVCETGWPTDGDSCCTGIPDETSEHQAMATPATASNYLYEFVADAAGRPYYISSAFDRDWRRIWSPCPFCAEENLALSSFENGICDLCEHDYQLGIFDQNRERKTNYKIPEVKCSLPELPKTRLAGLSSEPTVPAEVEEPSEEEKKKHKGLSRKEKLRLYREQQRRKRMKKKQRQAEEAAEEEEMEKKKKNKEEAAPPKEKTVNEAPKNETEPVVSTESEVSIVEDQIEETTTSEETLLEEQPDEETTPFEETSSVLSN